MSYLLGTDEAGYGPNLGPLVVSATLWHVPGAIAVSDLYERLPDVVSRRAADVRDPSLVVMADSKELYKPGLGLRHLETGVLAAWRNCGSQPRTWRELWSVADPGSEADRGRLPWYLDYEATLPADTRPETVLGAAERLQWGFRQAGVTLCGMQATAVYPQRLNQLIEQFGSKGTALTLTTLGLVQRMLRRAGHDPVYVVCDKHGGRNKYGRQLQEVFPDYLVEVLGESRSESIYRTGPPERRVEFRFRTHGESFLPSALASMVSKYLRELSMRAFNQFWQRFHPNLRPTAGYPVDARRFKQEILHVQRELAIDDQILWRSR